MDVYLPSSSRLVTNSPHLNGTQRNPKQSSMGRGMTSETHASLLPNLWLLENNPGH